MWWIGIIVGVVFIFLGACSGYWEYRYYKKNVKPIRDAMKLQAQEYLKKHDKGK